MTPKLSSVLTVGACPSEAVMFLRSGLGYLIVAFYSAIAPVQSGRSKTPIFRREWGTHRVIMTRFSSCKCDHEIVVVFERVVVSSSLVCRAV